MAFSLLSWQGRLPILVQGTFYFLILLQKLCDGCISEAYYFFFYRVFLLIQLISIISFITWLNECFQAQKDAERW